MGGGQDRDQALCAEDLATNKRDALHAARDRDKVIFAVCGGYQLLGHAYELDGTKLPGVGLVDLETVREDGPRLIGNVAIEVDLGRGPESSRASRTTAAGRSSAPPRPSAGCSRATATTAARGFEGVRGRNVIGTYLHGPLLPKNAWFADWLIQTANGRRAGAPRRHLRGRRPRRRPPRGGRRDVTRTIP